MPSRETPNVRGKFFFLSVHRFVVYQALLFLSLMVVLGIVKPVASNKRHKYN